ncbi:unnamed protein product [Rotaria socialis]|uniref:Uncharacterized protein n=1 Tax=Rotaria socialis TaxID=392032 RepID=A0A820Q7A0_9BILA|nr:unnamed protein product [Rotaria socialis]CAF3353608.1 unnamed protein product [Rotaria socialis]CAF3397893.1 unnamed protein product [Rotaria socialis]CAF3460277.1 unnamed protein product [Rotaria socialis]CAF3692793.1 unnamed protein product [Rotaria socialis]
MLTWFLRFLIFIIVCLCIAHSYPSPMSNQNWLAERIGHYPNGVYEIPSDSDENDPTVNNRMPTWLFRSRKFCCAPPL